MAESASEPGDLFEAHYDALHRYLVRLFGDEDVAEEASQEAFVRLVERSPTNLSEPRAWLYTVATNVARDHVRTRALRERKLEEGADAIPKPRLSPDPAEQLDRSTRRAAVRRALDRLEERDRTVLLLREEGFRHREIAEAVGTTTKSVGTMIARALGKLARELELEPGVLDGH